MLSCAVLQVRSPGELSYTYDANQIQRELIAQLEAKNRYWTVVCLVNTVLCVLFLILTSIRY